MTGDSVLKRLANSGASEIRATDIAARVGGNEFLVFLSEFADLKQLEEQVAALCRSMRVSHDNQVFTVSAGVAVTPKTEQTTTPCFPMQIMHFMPVRSRERIGFSFFE